MRILHFSDIHLDVPIRDIPLLEWLGKRVIGGLNLLLYRRRKFENVWQRFEKLSEFRLGENVDLVLCTGDYTLLGTEPEYKAVRSAVAPMYSSPLGFVSVPGNHDLYMPNTIRHKRFERYFGDSMTTDRPDLRVDGSWPAVRLFGPDVAVVSVNSSRPNPLPWRSSGKIPEPQLDGLRKVLADPDIASRFVFIMTHYAPRLANGQPDSWGHGLVNADEFLEVCSPVKRGAILCGHVHKCFRVRVPGLGPEIFCGGSATINEGGGFWVFDMNGTSMTPKRGERRGERYSLMEA